MLKKTALFAGFLFALTGCSVAPEPVGYPYGTQAKMQAAHHWDVLAEDVALQIKKRFAAACEKDQPEEEKIIEQKSVEPDVFYVDAQPLNTPFNNSFHELLISRLVAAGLPVVKSMTPDAKKIDYNIIVVNHDTNRNPKKAETKVGEILRQGISVVRDAATLGAFTAEAIPQSEIIVTFSIVEENKFLVHTTDIYYINDPDFWHYIESNRDNSAPKRLGVVGN